MSGSSLTNSRSECFSRVKYTWVAWPDLHHALILCVHCEDVHEFLYQYSKLFMDITVDDNSIQWIQIKSEAIRSFLRTSHGILWNGTQIFYYWLSARTRQGQNIEVIGSGTNKKAITRASYLAVAVASALEDENLRFYEPWSCEFCSFCNLALRSKTEHPAYSVDMSTSRFGVKVDAIEKYTAETKEHYLSLEKNDVVL